MKRDNWDGRATIGEGRDGSQMGARAIAFLVLLASACAGGTPVFAAAPAPAVSPKPAFTWTPYSFTETAFTVGGNKTQVFGARFQAHLRLPAKLHLTARLDATKTQDGGAVDIDVADPKTFTSVEGYFAIERELLGPITAMAVYGVTAPVLDGKLGILERYPKTLGAGFGLHVGHSWLAVVVARHDPSGSGAHVLIAGSYQVHDKTFLVGDGALGRGSYVRAGVGLRLKDDEK